MKEWRACLDKLTKVNLGIHGGLKATLSDRVPIGRAHGAVPPKQPSHLVGTNATFPPKY